jgi:hypothetical protein
MSLLHSREHLADSKQEQEQPQTQQRRRGQKGTYTECRCHYETQETLKKQEEHQKNEAVEECKKDPKNTEKVYKHKEKSRKRKMKQAFPYIMKKSENER